MLFFSLKKTTHFWQTRVKWSIALFLKDGMWWTHVLCPMSFVVIVALVVIVSLLFTCVKDEWFCKKCEEQLLGRGHIAEKSPQCKSSNKKVKERDYGGGGVKCSCCFVSLLQATTPCQRGYSHGCKKYWEIKLEWKYR